VVRAYLSKQHLDDVDASCPMVALPSDVARSDPAVKEAFENVFRAMVGLFERNPAQGRSSRPPASARDRESLRWRHGRRASPSMIPDLGDALRNAARRAALELGGWSADGKAKLRGERARR